jgi:hypothetical protein
MGYSEFAKRQAQRELEDAFEGYKSRALKYYGKPIENMGAIEPLMRQAFEKGIAPDRLAELMRQAD